jgi:hypothetical protein
VLEFGEWLCQEVVKAVPHRHVVLSLPKILRCYFLYDRKLLTDLSRCGWEALQLYFQKSVKGKKAVPGACVAIQTFGDLLGFHSHLHILISDGCFHENGMFTVSPAIDTKALEQLFRHKVLKLLYILEPELSPKEFRRNWARLIQKIYEVDPLAYPKCRGSMRVIAFIENEDVTKKILKHLDLWELKRKPSPRANTPFFIPDSYPVPSAYDCLIDPDYPIESYF